MGLFQFTILYFYLVVLKTCLAGSQYSSQIYPGFQASWMDLVEEKGWFLVSRNLAFRFGFITGLNINTRVLVVIHNQSGKVVWTANRGRLVDKSDEFVFNKTGNAYLKRGDDIVWATETEGKRVAAMELQDSGNLVVLGENRRILWQSFSHPTDTLLSGQEFSEGMKLKSFPKGNLIFDLEFKSGDLVLRVGYRTPQIYWSLANENRKTNCTASGRVHSSSLVSNSWNFYDRNKFLICQFVFSKDPDPNITWAAYLGQKGAIEFFSLQRGSVPDSEPNPEAIKIPQSPCSLPESCGNPYDVCYASGRCQCPPYLKPFDCRPPVAPACKSSRASIKLFLISENLDYFALKFVTPYMKPSLDACQEACLRNCSCLVLFYDNSTGRCFMFEQTGNLLRSQEGSNGYFSYVKISSNEESGKEKIHALFVGIIVLATVVIVAGLVYVGIWYYRKRKRLPEFTGENLEDDTFLDSFSGMPVRYSYNELCEATKNFSTKIGQGGFGSVYLGQLLNGTKLAVKKLEGIRQGMKEFRSEVRTIGSIHHVHLVKLKGFCAEGLHRLLVYEFMGKGSLDKWIFKNNQASDSLDWDTRFNIALGTAKGLAYLHEECEFKIVHCDIKPENVLLDDNFTAKVSDFGLAKLMNREESLVYTTLRGTRGYLAPEWITRNPISEKTDVYSYGMVLLEIIGGRKSYDPGESSEKAHFPSYAFRMLEEGRINEILDRKLNANECDERVLTAIKVGLWCIQDEMRMRPPMTKVVQMLEGLCDVPQPPTISLSGFRGYSSFIEWRSEESSSVGLTDHNSITISSDIQLSGPR